MVNPEGLSKDISLLTIICCPKSSDGNKLSSWKNVKRGTTVTLGANNDEVQGEVVSVSGEIDYKNIQFYFVFFIASKPSCLSEYPIFNY